MDDLDGRRALQALDARTLADMATEYRRGLLDGGPVKWGLQDIEALVQAMVERAQRYKERDAP